MARNRYFALGIAMFTSTFGACTRQSARAPEGRVIVVASVAEIEPIRLLREGFEERLRTDSESFVLKYENAQGDGSLIAQIADRVAQERPALVYVLGTTLAQAIQARTPDVPLVQGAATDPVSSGLALSWERSGKLYAATSDRVSAVVQLQLIRTMVPSVRRIGVIYNPAEANSVASVAALRVATASMPQVVLREAAVSQGADVALALASLDGKVDVLFIPPDNTVYTSIAQIGRYALRRQLPLFATESSALGAGAVAVQSVEFRELGRRSADLAMKILHGADPRGFPIVLDSFPQIIVSRRNAKTVGLVLDQVKTFPRVTFVDSL